jgi:hypothetical protein
MPRKRPTAVTVMGILNIIFGSLGLLCSLCSGIMVLTNMAGANAGVGGPNNVQVEMMKMVEAEVPAYQAVQIAQVIFYFILSVMLLMSGIGLLNMQNWARMAAIAYAVIDIVVRIAALVYQLAFINPVMMRAMDRAMQLQMQQFPGPNRPPVPNMSALTGIINVVTVIVALVVIAFDVILLIIMLLPRVAAAFALRPPPDDDERRDGDEDEDDLDRERRRRDEWSE